MITMDSEELYNLLGQCAVLRGRGNFSEAIALVEPHIKNNGARCTGSSLSAAHLCCERRRIQR